MNGWRHINREYHNAQCYFFHFQVRLFNSQQCMVVFNLTLTSLHGPLENIVATNLNVELKLSCQILDTKSIHYKIIMKTEWRQKKLTLCSSGCTYLLRRDNKWSELSITPKLCHVQYQRCIDWSFEIRFPSFLMHIKAYEYFIRSYFSLSFTNSRSK